MSHLLSDEIDRYLEYCISKQLRPKTMEAYEQGLRLFCKWACDCQGYTYCEEISEAVIRRYIVDLQRRGKYTLNTRDDDELTNYPWNRTDYRESVSNTTINNYIRYLRAFFLWLEYEEILDRTPMRRVKVLPDQRKPKEYLEDDEVKQLLSVMDRSIVRSGTYGDNAWLMKIFITGSRCISSLEDYTCAKLRSIYDKGYDVLIGDCYGADTLIQHFFYTLGYKQVTIYASLGHARNNIGNWKVKAIPIPIPKGVYGYRMYETKDIAMADDADFGFMIWDGESKGTRKNIERLIGQGKQILIHLPDQK